MLRELLPAVEYVPLPNLGLSPKNTFTVSPHEFLIATETLDGVLGVELSDAPLVGAAATAPGVGAAGAPAAGVPIAQAYCPSGAQAAAPSVRASKSGILIEVMGLSR